VASLLSRDVCNNSAKCDPGRPHNIVVMGSAGFASGGLWVKLYVHHTVQKKTKLTLSATEVYDEERSEMRYVMRIAKSSESSKL
jgi:hypothetical protein